MMRKVFIIAFTLGVSTYGWAQQQPAIINVDPTQSSPPVSILDNTGSWIQFGVINPILHTFSLTLNGNITAAAATVNGSVFMPGLPTNAGAGGMYICVDSVGNLYKNTTCP